MSSLTAAAKAKFKWEDPFMLEDQLSDDERAIQDAAHQFARTSCKRAC